MSAENKTVPTTPGWYVQADEPLTEISTIFLLNNLGDWWDGHRHASEEEMLHYAPLSRLVMENDTAQHPEVDIQAAREAFAATYSHSIDDPDDDFEAVLARVLNGEFNK